MKPLKNTNKYKVMAISNIAALLLSMLIIKQSSLSIIYANTPSHYYDLIIALSSLFGFKYIFSKAIDSLLFK